MSKAVLVMDMPSSCIGCNFLHCEIEENKEYCEARESICPNCLGVVITHKTEYPKFCVNCGQKIDWSVEE